MLILISIYFIQSNCRTLTALIDSDQTTTYIYLSVAAAAEDL